MTSSPSSTQPAGAAITPPPNEQLSPVEEKDGDVVLGAGAANVGRSRTLPSSKTPPASGEKVEKDKPPVLKKKTRPFSLTPAAKMDEREKEKEKEKKKRVSKEAP